jgi:hypothetical protein
VAEAVAEWEGPAPELVIAEGSGQFVDGVCQHLVTLAQTGNDGGVKVSHCAWTPLSDLP